MISMVSMFSMVFHSGSLHRYCFLQGGELPRITGQLLESLQRIMAEHREFKRSENCP